MIWIFYYVVDSLETCNFYEFPEDRIHPDRPGSQPTQPRQPGNPPRPSVLAEAQGPNHFVSRELTGDWMKQSDCMEYMELD